MIATMISTSLNEQQQTVLEIDHRINRLVKRIELLAYVNPLNIAQEKKQFFKSKFNYEPSFRYRKIGFDPYKLHRLLYSQRLDRIENDSLQSLYKDLVYTYSGLLQCVETIGDPNGKFFYNSLRFFGTPTQKMVDNARYILHFEDESPNQSLEDQIYNTSQAVQFFEEQGAQYNFDFKIKTSSAMSAMAMVSNKDRALILKKNSTFSRHQLEVLAHHEIGVHLVTTFNAVDQPLKIFSNGFPNNVETQEGLAVMAEFLSGNLTVKRLKELAYRVIAADSLIKGFSFQDTFDLIHNQYKVASDTAFNITLRAHRGGGWTKDALYLSGLKNIYQLFQQGENLDNMFLGKCSLEYQNAIDTLHQIELVAPLSHQPLSFKQSKNSNKTVEFILNNLK
ncbi:MAG: tyrosine/phenylalanine carboxypeptidase domain-containing protein [Nonlabens sp.]